MKRFLILLCITYSICFLVIKYHTRTYDLINAIFTKSFQQEIKSDLDYKEQIIKDSNLPNLTIEELSSIVGPYELMDFIKKNNNNPSIYTPTDKNFQANFHSHTTVSDGSLEPAELLDLAQNHAKKNPSKPFYLAITDHNKTRSGKEILEILDNNAEKYKNIKIILGMEVFSFLQPRLGINPNEVAIHVTTLAINPYDKELNKIFKEKHKNDKWNLSYRTFESAVILLNKKGLVGIAHPARYIEDAGVKDYKKYFEFLFKKYKYITRNSFNYTEAYYQSYKTENPEIIKYIESFCDEININKIGSIDNHGKSFFKK